MNDPRRRTEEPAVLRALAEALPGPDLPELIAAAWEPNQVWLTLQGPSEPLSLLIEPRDESRPRFTRTARLNVSYAGEDLPDGCGRLIERCVTALGGLRFEELSDLLLERLPPEAETPEAGEPQREDPARERMRSLAGLWGRGALWDQFLAERVRQGAEVKLVSPSAVVMHGEYECCFVHGEVPGVPHQPFLESRWSALPYPSAPGARAEAGHSAYFTDLSEGDAIQGRGRARLKGILGELAGENDRFALCHFNATCVPTVLHDDSTGLLARFRKDSEIPLYHVTEERPSATASLVPVLRRRLEACAATQDPAQAGAVGLVGYAEDGDGDPLPGLLEAVGVAVTGAALPVLDLDDVSRVAGAGAIAYRPDDQLDDLYGPFRELDRCHVDADAPYGPGRTERWLTAVGDAVGRRDEVIERWRVLWGGLEPEWVGLRARAATHALLLVLRLDQLVRLGEPRRCHGVPLIPVLDEMGFQLALAVPAADSDPEELRQRALDVWARQAPRPPVALTVVHDRAQLSQLLASGRTSACLSDIRFDDRLTTGGVGRFSANDLRMGPRGALETLGRLLRICEVPFTRRYARFLGGEDDTRGR